MRFCFLATYYPPYNFGGDGVHTRRLAEALVRNGHEVVVVHDLDAYEAFADAPESPAYHDDDRIVHRSIGGSTLGRLDLLLAHQAGHPVLKRSALRSVLDEQEFDVVHFHNVSLLGGPGVLRYGSGIKLCTLNDYWFVCPMHILWRFDREPCTKRSCLRCTLAGKRPPQLWRQLGAVSRSARGIDAFITGSEFSRRKHAENGLAAPVHVIHPFVLPEDRATPLAHEQGPDSRSFFLYSGRLEKYKGVHTLIDRFREHRAADLWIAGAGDFEPMLQRQAAGLSHIRFLGQIGREPLRELYSRAVATIVPSLCYETFGLVAIESLAQGTPVIARSGGAVAEVVEETGGGIVYGTDSELFDAIEALRVEPDLRRQLGERGRRKVESEYTEEAHLERYFALIDEIHAHGARKGPSSGSTES